MKYKGISSRERELLEELKRRNILVFDPLNAANILTIRQGKHTPDTEQDGI